MPYVYYTGFGAMRPNGIHSVEEFLGMMRTNATAFYHVSRAQGFDMEYKNYMLPEDFPRFTLQDWVDYVGAEYYDQDWDW